MPTGCWGRLPIAGRTRLLTASPVFLDHASTTGLSAKRWCTALTVVAVLLGVAATSASAAGRGSMRARAGQTRANLTRVGVRPARSRTMRARAFPHGKSAGAAARRLACRDCVRQRPEVQDPQAVSDHPAGDADRPSERKVRAFDYRNHDRRAKCDPHTDLQACKAPPPTTTHSLSVALAGTGSGKVTGSGISCPGACSHSYTAGTKVALTATPASGSSFAGWSGAGCTGTGTCTVTMSSDQSVTATFTANPPPPSYTLSVALAGTGAGSVTGSGISCPGVCSASYTAGTTVTLTATPASGSSFAGWSGAGCSGTGTCTVTMSGGQSVTATFTANAPRLPR